MTGGNKSFGHYREVKQIRQQRVLSAQGRTKLIFFSTKRGSAGGKKNVYDAKETTAMTCGVAV